jgi:hypothetical protein
MCSSSEKNATQSTVAEVANMEANDFLKMIVF